MKPVSGKDRRKTSGFALYETVIVVAIISIISLAIIPKIASVMQNMRLNAAAQRVATDIRLARVLAISNHGTYGIEFNQGGNSYYLYSWDGVNKTTLAETHTGQPHIVDFDDIPEYQGITISSLSMCSGINCFTAEIRIDPFGVPSDGTDTAFTNPATVALQSGSSTKTVQVTPETAFTELV